MSVKIKALTSLLFCIAIIVFPKKTLAQGFIPVPPGPPAPGSGTITNPVLSPDLQSSGGAAFFDSLLSILVTLGFIVGSIVFFFMFAIGAIKWIASGGDKVQVEAAQKTLTSAVIGIFVLFAVYAIIAFVENIFGINILVLDIGSLRIQ